MYRIAFLLFGSGLWWSCAENKTSTLPYYNEPDFTPLFIQNKAEVPQKITHTIGAFSLLNQDSVRVDNKTIEGKIHVANFIFTSCGSICPVMTQHMKRVCDRMQDDENLVLLSYSVTPWIDTPFVLHQFKKKNGIQNPRWHFLTGSKSAIYSLARKSYFAEADLGYSKDSTEFLHTEHFVLVDKTQRIRGIYNGTLAVEMQNLLEDIRTLKMED